MQCDDDATQQDRTTIEAFFDREEGCWEISFPAFPGIPARARTPRRRRDAASQVVAGGFDLVRGEFVGVDTLGSPRLPGRCSTHPSWPLDRRLAKSSTWFLGYPGVIETVGFGDFSVADLVRVFDSMPDDVVAVATCQITAWSKDAWMRPSPSDIATSYMVVDSNEIRLVVDRDLYEREMGTTVRGIPLPCLPLLRRRTLAARITSLVEQGAQGTGPTRIGMAL